MDRSKSYLLPKSFLLHYDNIDAEHEALIAIVNECLGRSVDGRLHEFEGQFEKFMAALKAHFANEEKKMRDLGYPELEPHLEVHAQCLDQVSRMWAQARSQGYAGLEITHKCFDEIVSDIVWADLKFGEYLAANDLQRPAR